MVPRVTTRAISARDITDAVERLCREANIALPDDAMGAFEQARAREVSPMGQAALDQLLENFRIARQEQIAVCQDTGMAVVFLEVGQQVQVVDGDLTEAINEGVRRGYVGGYLRYSVVGDPLKRKNTGDNTPAVIHTSIVPGNQLKITVLPKGFGAEMWTRLAMLTPAQGVAALKDFVVESVDRAGPDACPPVTVGVGIGGTAEYAVYLAKKALIRPVGRPHPDPDIAALEAELLERINRLGIGPEGMGGVVTALAVHVETYPTHIVGIPVAVNLNCAAPRHKEVVL